MGPPAPKTRPSASGSSIFLAGLFTLIGLAAAAYFLFLDGSSVPSEFDISGSRLLVLNEKGRTLWPFDTRLDDLESAEFYRGHFQKKGLGPRYDAVWPMVMIKDLDGDGRFEVLLSLQTRSEDGEGIFVCLDDKGVERWRFEAGRD